jgi:hypothetical protein
VCIETRKTSSGVFGSTVVAVMMVFGVTASVMGSDAKVFELNTSEAVSDIRVPSSMLAQTSALAFGQSEETTEVTTTDVAKDESSFPVSIGIKYSIYSDYIYRFVNYSEYATEGREKLNHQLGVDFGVGLGDYGTLKYIAWFEWFAAQKEINGSGQNVQEIDHSIEWDYTFDQIMTDFAFGVTFYSFPNSDPGHSFEYYFSFAHNDAWMWKSLFPDNDEGVLNPTLYIAHDVDELGGMWFQLNFSHPFELFENFTLTPGWMLAVDGQYYTESAIRFAGDQWSLVAEYDIGKAVQLPEWAGSLTIDGELYFNNAWGTMERDGTAQDEFWGGMTLNWSWGG